MGPLGSNAVITLLNIGSSPPDRAPNHAVHTSDRLSLPIQCQAAPMEHVGSSGLPNRQLLETSHRQMRILGGGSLVWRLSCTQLLFGGVLWIWDIPELGALHRTARQIRITILQLIICKWELMKLCFINKVREERIRYLA